MKRSEIENLIEALLTVLDQMDGDFDLEDTGDQEPSLGWSLTNAIGNDRDLELDAA